MENDIQAIITALSLVNFLVIIVGAFLLNKKLNVTQEQMDTIRKTVEKTPTKLDDIALGIFDGLKELKEIIPTNPSDINIKVE